MLKRIPVEQLRLGMYLKKFVGSWLDHPFWRTGFVLADPKDLDAVRASPVREVWIDSARGQDVSEAEAVPSVARPGPPSRGSPSGKHATQSDVVPTCAADEVARATHILRASRRAVVGLFEAARLGNLADLELALPVVADISDSVMRNPGALISIARIKTADDYTYLHSVAVCAMMVALARQMRLDSEAVRIAGLAGLLHDVGKIAIPTEVLNKPGKLTDKEYALMRTHAAAGYDMLLGGGNVPADALDVCLHHHEKMDGSGYPHGLKGEQISLLARMGAVADVYDAVTSNRPYKHGWDPAEALRQMTRWTGEGHFDPDLFQAFVSCVGIYPIGSLVRLASGRVGVVVDTTPQSLTTPRVKVFFSSRSGMRIPPEVVDLGAKDARDRIVGREDSRRWAQADIDAMWMDPPLS